MGGMTTYYLTLRYKYLFEGAIMMAPAIKNNVSGFLVGVTNTLASILGKKTKLMKPIYGRASRNPKITEDIKNDPYSFSERARLSTLQMLVSTMDKTSDTFPMYKCPFMIIQGGLDKLVNPDGAF
jgi:acylglycerol lipase